MDPNETLRLLRSALTDLCEAVNDAGADWMSAAERAVQHGQCLDEHITAGGALPDAWQRPREYSYESEDVNGRAGTVTYTVPAGVPVASEADASDNAIDTRWTYPDGTHKHPNYSVGIPPRCPQCGQANPGPSLPAEYSAVGLTEPKWAARLAREAYAYCDRDHPGGDQEAHDWHKRYHT